MSGEPVRGVPKHAVLIDVSWVPDPVRKVSLAGVFGFPVGVGPREWLRWVLAWSRGSGHSWTRVRHEVVCSACGLEAVASWLGDFKDRRGVTIPESPRILRKNLLEMLREEGTCDVGRVRQVQES